MAKRTVFAETAVALTVALTVDAAREPLHRLALWVLAQLPPDAWLAALRWLAGIG